MSKKIISARPSSPAFEELVLECIQPQVQKVLKYSADDMNSLASDLFDPDMNLADVPMPNGKDYKHCSIDYILSVHVVMGEFLNAQKGLGGDPSSLIHGIRDRRGQGEQIGRWRSVREDELQ